MTWLKKNKLLIILVIVFLLLNNLPYLAGIYRSATDSQITYNGSPLVNEGDYFVYLSYIEQGQDNIFIRNLYDYQAEEATLFTPLWFTVGQVAKVTSNVISYHIFRIIFSLFFIAVLWWWLKKIFDTYKKQLLALAMVLFANGLGVLFLSFWPNTDISPINLWVSEANTFLNLYQGPLFSLSQALILLVFALFIKSIQESKSGLIPLYGLLAVFLFISHPYELVIVNLLLTAWAGLEYWQTKNKEIIRHLLYLYLASLLAGLYYIWLFQDPSMEKYKEQNIVSSGHILEYLFGFGLVTVLSLVGVYFSFKNKLLENTYLKFIVLWGLAGWLMVYLPFNFNRRLANGWHIPLAILSTLGLIYAYKKIPNFFKSGLVAVIVIALSFDTLYHIILYTDQTYHDSREANVYISSDRKAIYEIVDLSINDDDIILTRELEGNRLPVNKMIFRCYFH